MFQSTLSIHSLDFKPETGSVFEVSVSEEEAAQEARTLRHEESERERELEPDSDAERLSPLLTHAAPNGVSKLTYKFEILIKLSCYCLIIVY